MTYAELYGNIKKRPHKCGLDNILIFGDRGAKGSVVNEFFKGSKFASEGDTMSIIKENVSPLTRLSKKSSIFDNETSPLSGAFSNGIYNALSISNYR